MDIVETEKILTAAEMFGIVGDELREKNAEIERLREALKYIATLQPWESQSKFIIEYAIDKLKEKE